MTELREYMLFCISRDIQASDSCRAEELGGGDAEFNNEVACDNPTSGGDSPVTPAKQKGMDDLLARLKAI